ncbi:DoxX family protein [Ensifer adhaerens]|uniref:DoxX family protein n=1 Tax=Ensifer adhaerens TaxID=106592 RepID=UPI00384B543B
MAVVVEIGGGLLLFVGFRSRIVAGLLAAFCIVTAFAFHADLADQIQATNFLKNMAIAGGLLQIVAFGSGALSVDGRGISDRSPAA